jgi:hypothetical protein
MMKIPKNGKNKPKREPLEQCAFEYRWFNKTIDTANDTIKRRRSRLIVDVFKIVYRTACSKCRPTSLFKLWRRCIEISTFDTDGISGCTTYLVQNKLGAAQPRECGILCLLKLVESINCTRLHTEPPSIWLSHHNGRLRGAKKELDTLETYSPFPHTHALVLQG